MRKNRAIPFRALLVDNQGIEITGGDLISPPVINVSFLAVSGGESEDVTDEALPAGHGTEGNAFIYTGERWQYNLSTRNYDSPGTYVVTMRSGDENEYLVEPTCTGTFVIE